MAGPTGPAAGAPSGAAPFGVQAGGAPAVITPGASPFTYTNVSGNIEFVKIQAAAGGTTTVAKRGVTVANMVQAAATNSTDTEIVGPGESIVVTYAAAPTMLRDVP